jgi:hypothetical protein
LSRTSPYKIETLEKCNKFLAGCRQRGWKVWQMQYKYYSPEGFHAWFILPREPDIEVVTHNKAVQDAIVEYNS